MSGNHLTLGVETSSAALHAYRPDWEALWVRLRNATPFQHPAWLLSWWEQFGTAEPRVAWIRSDRTANGRLLGILPLYVLAEPGGRKLLPIGAGLSDYQDLLAEPELAPVFARSGLLSALRAEVPPDLADLVCLPPGCALRDAGRISAATGWAAELHETDPCPVLDLSAPVPTRQRRKFRMAQHRAERRGGWQVDQATAETLDTLWQELHRLHQARWTAAGKPGVLADPRVPAFLRRAVQELLPAGLARLYALRIDGQVAAACLALLCRDRVLFYLSGYDAAFEFESPGTILLGHMLEEAAREGRREAHFLRGNESYKYAWGAVDRWNATLSLRPAAARS